VHIAQSINRIDRDRREGRGHESFHFFISFVPFLSSMPFLFPHFMIIFHLINGIKNEVYSSGRFNRFLKFEFSNFQDK
jgi:hypothetical protein